MVERGNRALHYADVYHKLKRPDRFDYLRARPHLLSSSASADPPRCSLLTSKYRVRRRGQLVARVEHCCEHWQWCELATTRSTFGAHG